MNRRGAGIGYIENLKLFSSTAFEFVAIYVESRNPAKNVLAIFYFVIYNTLLFLFFEEIELDHIIKKKGDCNSPKWNHWVCPRRIIWSFTRGCIN